MAKTKATCSEPSKIKKPSKKQDPNTVSPSGLPIRTHNYIIGKLRQVFGWHAPRAESRKRALHSSGLYKCAKCLQLFDRAETDVEHTDPVIPLSGFDSWSGYIARLFCGVEGLQIFCKPCHKVKTKFEVGERARLRKEKANENS